MLRIYGRAASINVRKLLWLCDEIDLSYERLDFGRGFQPTDTEAYLAMNPTGLVPTIEDEGFTLWESNAILRYLASKYGPETLYGPDLRMRALNDQWLDWQTGEVTPPMKVAFIGLHLKFAPFTEAVFLEPGLRDWTRLMGLLDKRLAETGAFVIDSNFRLADIPLGLVVNRWFTLPVERPDTPALAAYYERLSERPGFRSHGRNGLP